jgi:hypothetical protein
MAMLTDTQFRYLEAWAIETKRKPLLEKDPERFKAWVEKTHPTTWKDVLKQRDDVPEDNATAALTPVADTEASMPMSKKRTGKQKVVASTTAEMAPNKKRADASSSSSAPSTSAASKRHADKAIAAVQKRGRMHSKTTSSSRERAAVQFAVANSSVYDGVIADNSTLPWYEKFNQRALGGKLRRTRGSLGPVESLAALQAIP